MAIAATGHGKNLMARPRDVIAQMVAEEKRLLARHEAAASAA
ncbi:hypothetical protein [Rubellimicrobium rubrum]|nr:hypothetical protein [Rubellimicrobium rubrum]